MTTFADVQAWINNAEGQWHDFDGYWGAQCVDLAQFYSQWLGGHRFWGDAVNIFDQPGNFYEQIPNDVNDPNQLPRLGDIIVWNGTFGHVAVVQDADASGFTSLDQNWYTANDTGSIAVKVRHNWNRVKGWLRPKNIVTNQAGDKPMNRDEEARAYQIVLGRDMDHNGTGRSGYQFITDAQAELQQQKDARNRTAQERDEARQQLAHVQSELERIKTLPPKEVVKEVEKIVEVTKEVPVYVHDEETKDQVNQILKLVTIIFDYFKGQYKTFSKYIKK